MLLVSCAIVGLTTGLPRADFVLTRGEGHHGHQEDHAADVAQPLPPPLKHCELQEAATPISQECFLEPKCENKCEDKTEEICTEYPEEECRTVDEVVCEEEKEQKCTKVLKIESENVCETIETEQCKDVTRNECRTVVDQKCEIK